MSISSSTSSSTSRSSKRPATTVMMKSSISPNNNFWNRVRRFRLRRLLLYYVKQITTSLNTLQLPLPLTLRPQQQRGGARRPTKSRILLNSFFILCLISITLLTIRNLYLFILTESFPFIDPSGVLDDDTIASLIRPGTRVPKDTILRERLAWSVDNHTRRSINMWRQVDTNCPLETNAPSPSLYGTGSERCFSIGLPTEAANRELPKQGDPAIFWQMNSRALCYNPKRVCLMGNQMKRLLSFEPRGSGTCQVVSVKDGRTYKAKNVGLNESCAAFRKRYVVDMYGHEIFEDDYKTWETEMNRNHNRHNPNHMRPNHRMIRYTSLSKTGNSNFAIVIPKYPWSYNICHFNRLWNYAMWIIRNLKLFMPINDVQSINEIDILFRSRGKYSMIWHEGMKQATIKAVERDTGFKINVGHLRKDVNAEAQCLQRSIWLGKEGRIDSFPFLNDSDVWKSSQQLDDSHWPFIPHDSLWLRQVIIDHYNLSEPSLKMNYSSNKSLKYAQFHSIPLPPKRIAVLQRSKKAKRRFTRNGLNWFNELLHKLAKRYDMEIQYIRVTKDTPFKTQVSDMLNVGMSVGLHGANIVNTMFQPAAGVLFEIFPWHYVRYYYAAGANTGLRYGYHEPIAGTDPNCNNVSVYCAFRHREAIVYLTKIDHWRIQAKLYHAFEYLHKLHERYPSGHIPLVKNGNVYHFGDDIHNETINMNEDDYIKLYNSKYNNNKRNKNNSDSKSND